LPGSTKEYEWSKVAGTANPPDWFPDEHPPAPKAVTGGPGIRFACGACHLMSGQSHSESADIAGMPAEYLIQEHEIEPPRADPAQFQFANALHLRALHGRDQVGGEKFVTDAAAGDGLCGLDGLIHRLDQFEGLLRHPPDLHRDQAYASRSPPSGFS
jgi:hypothetical protein